MVTSGSSTLSASTRSASASSFARTKTINGARGGARATDVFWAFALLAGGCSVCKMALRGAPQHKHRSCTVAFSAADVPMPVVFVPRIPVVEELSPTPATKIATPVVMRQNISPHAGSPTPQMMLESQLRQACVAPPLMAPQIKQPRTAAFPATMVGGARCTTAARRAARHAMRRKAAHTAAASHAARRAVGSRLQASLCQQEVPSLTFDASRQRLKIQAGLHLANRVRIGHMREIRSPVGISEKSNGVFTTCFCMTGDFTYSTKLSTCQVCAVASDSATWWPAPMHY